ncbi:hypothetical protein GCM10011609_11960 [Lentzea pudingi]|uniref:Uncharacterized protein n=1 Tax=Lentzea pudingi TaxID=1789439 RepID=A0ABQ2HF91_9PSEU|nr:hypothetical protein GCM10011609_11960 [Lentzea pudingi]
MIRRETRLYGSRFSSKDAGREQDGGPVGEVAALRVRWRLLSGRWRLLLLRWKGLGRWRPGSIAGTEMGLPVLAGGCCMPWGGVEIRCRATLWSRDVERPLDSEDGLVLAVAERLIAKRVADAAAGLAGGSGDCLDAGLARGGGAGGWSADG